MKVLICGSRHWDNIEIVCREMGKLPPGTEIIHGGAKGADMFAGIIAMNIKMPVKVFHADWDTHGRAAGPIRNQQMIDENPDLVLAFTEDLSASRGTADTVRRAKAKGIEVRVIDE